MGKDGILSSEHVLRSRSVYDGEEAPRAGHMKEPKSRVPAVTSAHCGGVRGA